MNLQQLQALATVADEGFSMSAAAEALYRSQPGVSAHIRALEEELGMELFFRQGKRLTGLTPAGEALLPLARQAVQAARNLKTLAASLRGEEEGMLKLATTPTQVRFRLPQVIASFRRLWPKVAIYISEVTPAQAVDLVLRNHVDVAIVTEGQMPQEGLVALGYETWRRVVITPLGHPLDQAPLSLEALAAFPLVTYRFSLEAGPVAEAFAHAGITPKVALATFDALSIKTYVRLGLGVGIVAETAMEEKDRECFCIFPDDTLFAASTTSAVLKKGALLKKFLFDFLRLLSPLLDPDKVQKALAR